jgi:hypothetical protein
MLDLRLLSASELPDETNIAALETFHVTEINQAYVERLAAEGSFGGRGLMLEPTLSKVRKRKRVKVILIIRMPNSPASTGCP